MNRLIGFCRGSRSIKLTYFEIYGSFLYDFLDRAFKYFFEGFQLFSKLFSKTYGFAHGFSNAFRYPLR